MNGFYRLMFAGQGGAGAGALAFANGKVAGVDLGGGVYQGTYQVQNATGEVSGTVKVTFPKGGYLVTGVPAAVGSSFDVPFAFVPAGQGSTPITVQTPTGPVTGSLEFVAAL